MPDPADVKQTYDRAHRYFEAKDYLTAAQLFGEVLDAEPDDVSARLLLARAFFHSAQLSRAEAAAREVIERAPAEGYAYLLLGRSLQRQRRHEEARGPMRMAETMLGLDATILPSTPPRDIVP